MATLSGSAGRVGQAAPAETSSAGAVSGMSVAASEAVSAADFATSSGDSGDTSWVEYRAAAASLMLFSPDGTDEESDIRFEPARVFVRRLDNQDYLMITGEKGEPPPPDTGN